MHPQQHRWNLLHCVSADSTTTFDNNALEDLIQIIPSTILAWTRTVSPGRNEGYLNVIVLEFNSSTILSVFFSFQQTFMTCPIPISGISLSLSEVSLTEIYHHTSAYQMHKIINFLTFFLRLKIQPNAFHNSAHSSLTHGDFSKEYHTCVFRTFFSLHDMMRLSKFF